MKRKQPWIAAILNFVSMGLGYIYNGRRWGLGILFTIGALVLTYVEFQLKPIDTRLYNMMFAAVFVINTAFAIDGYREANEINTSVSM